MQYTNESPYTDHIETHTDGDALMTLTPTLVRNVLLDEAKTLNSTGHKRAGNSLLKFLFSASDQQVMRLAELIRASKA